MPLLALAIQELPNIISLIKSWHQSANPGAPEPTDDEVIAALHAAVQSSIAKDDLWIAQHPPNA